jgi:hypothetical protein
MKDLQIIDDFLDKEIIDDLDHNFLKVYPHYYRGRSDPGFSEGSTFYNYTFYDRRVDTPDILSPIAKMLIEKVTPFIEDLELDMMYFNLQHPGMGGSPHLDHNPDVTEGLTVLLMVTQKGIGGDFMYKEKDIFEHIEYKKNRLIIFNGGKSHYGKCFDDVPRITLAFKFEKLK